MVFEAPTLLTYSDDDDDYVERWNSNVQTLVNSLESVEAELASIGAAQGTLIQSDWYRRLTGGSPLGGVVGKSLRFNDAGSNTVQLLPNSDGVNVAAIGGQRRYNQAALTYDLTSLSLGDGDFTIYVGIDALGDTSMSVSAAVLAEDISVALYELDVTVLTDVYTINQWRRVPETLIWDNTIEQSSQKIPMIYSFSYESLNVGENTRILVPVQCSVSKLHFHQIDDLGLSQIDVRNSAETEIYIQMLIGTGLASDSIFTQDVEEEYDGVTIAAGEQLLIKPISVGSPGRASVVLELLPTY